VRKPVENERLYTELDGYIGLNTVQCSLQRLTLMPHGNTIPLYTSVEGKRDYVVRVGIKNRWIVGNHYFSLYLVPIIQNNPLYTYVEGKRDYVVRVGIKTQWMVGNHYFSLCLVPIIQTRIITFS